MTFSARPRRQARRFDEVTRHAAFRVTRRAATVFGGRGVVSRRKRRDTSKARSRSATSRTDDGSSFVLYRRRFFLSASLICLMRSVGRWTCNRPAERGARRPFALAVDSWRGERCCCRCRRQHDPRRACAFARAVDLTFNRWWFRYRSSRRSFVGVALQLRRGSRSSGRELWSDQGSEFAEFQ